MTSGLAPPVPPDTDPTPAPPAERGTLVIEPRAVEHIAARVVRDAGAADGASVSVERLDETVELTVRLSMPYPEQSLVDSIEPVRRSVVERVGRLVGRPVTRLDMEVTSFTVPAPAPVRRVR